MTKQLRSLILPVAAVALIACGDDDDDSGRAVRPDPEPAAPATAFLRVAHLSPDAPAVDLCIAPAGTGTFTGPVLASLGAADGLAYAQVTGYVEVEARQWDVRLVAPGAASCAASLGGLPDVTDLPALPAGASATAAAIGLLEGEGAEAFRIAAFVDAREAAAGEIALRFVHAAPTTPAVDVGLGAGDGFTPVFTGVAFGEAGTGAGVGPDGYLATGPLADATITARVSGTEDDALSLEGLAVPAGTVATAFAIGNAADLPLQVLLCSDGPGTGLLSECTALP